MTDRALDLDDIQGNVLGGFNTNVQDFLFFSLDAKRERDAALWLAARADEVTPVSAVKAARTAIKTASGLDAPTWLFLAVSHGLLKSLAPDVFVSDIAFIQGHLARAKGILNDLTDPQTWVAGSLVRPIDVLLIVGGNVEATVMARADTLVEAATGSGLTLVWREAGRRLDDDEHFGFRDGISQPLISGFDPGGTMGAGHFVFGYPRKTGEAPVVPRLDPRGVADNGSLMVWRRLGQDVQAFRDFCKVQAAALSAQWPGFDAAHLAALLVGRWPSGAPVLKGQTTDPKPESSDNGFDFSNDSDGKSCPFGAHVRKVNPRAGKKDVVDVPRMIRRGIPYGQRLDEAPDKPDRGLTFVSFQTSITDQFEFLTQHWMNSDSKPAPESDLLVGRRSPPGVLNIQGPDGAIPVQGPNRFWIIPSGGAYLFAPGRAGLRKLADPPSSHGWKLAQALMLEMTGPVEDLL